MDLTNLTSWANAINGQTSPNIKRYALEQVRVTRDQEARLAKIEAVLASAAAAEAETLNQTVAAIRALKV